MVDLHSWCTILIYLKIAEVMALLQGAQEQWSLHTEQQTDSIRYLNELNTVGCQVMPRPSIVERSVQWLEAFVNHGTSQIENVAAGIQMLCKELGRHAHVDYCRAQSGDACSSTGVEHITTPMHPDPKRAKDFVTHDLFWRRTGECQYEHYVLQYPALTDYGAGFKGQADNHM